MSIEWSNSSVAVLKVNQVGGSDTFTFNGVSSDPSAGSPQTFLDAANHLLNIGGLSAHIDGIKRTVYQEGVEE